MQRTSSPAYRPLRSFLETIPVIDAHEHYFAGMNCGPCDIFQICIDSYASCDLSGISPLVANRISEEFYAEGLSFDQRYAAFEPLYRKVMHTGYFHGSREGMRRCWDVNDYNKPTLAAAQERVNRERCPARFFQLLDQYHIQAMIIDPCGPDTLFSLVENKGQLPNAVPHGRLAFSMPSYHFEQVRHMRDRLASFYQLPIDSLSDYIAVLDRHIGECIGYGVVALKDQSAYQRDLCYTDVPAETAQRLYHKLMDDEGALDHDEKKQLSNYLFRRMLDSALKYNVPVQIHTGYPTGLYSGDIRRTDAAQLVDVITDYPQLHFNLFHGNWPSMDAMLYYAKNYPNVSINLCWVQSIDPYYSVELLKHLVVSAPGNKVVAFGADDSHIEHTVGFLSLAQDNVATALSDLIDSGWLTLAEAKGLACDWFFNNPNEIFKLGFDPVQILLP